MSIRVATKENQPPPLFLHRPGYGTNFQANPTEFPNCSFLYTESIVQENYLGPFI